VFACDGRIKMKIVNGMYELNLATFGPIGTGWHSLS